MNTAVVDTIIPYGSDPKTLELLRDYSTLYTAASDALFYGVFKLGEQADLTSRKLRIEVRWPAAAETKQAKPVSHFNRSDYTIRLTASDSKRDDESRYAILHEFGHAFDYITNSNVLRAAAGFMVNYTNHGGYLNGSSSDSYIEVFATFFAGSVQLYSDYENPHILSFIDLGTPGNYKAWGKNCTDEELAVASLLYQTHFLIKDAKAYWALLNPDRTNFYEYYQALKTYLDEHNTSGAQTFEDYAYDFGLFKMPFGNGQYDTGEPFIDINRNGILDKALEPYEDLNNNGVFDEDDFYRDYNNNEERDEVDEPFADLMFATDKDGIINFSKPLQEFDRSELVMGQSSDVLRNRDTVNTIHPAENSYLYLSGEPVEYLVVDILPDGRKGKRSLMGASEGKVLIGLPGREQTGIVVVSVPGGSTIFKGNIAAMQQRFSETIGLEVPLAKATVSAGNLAPEGTQATATYGSTEASGVFTAPEFKPQELIQLADGYDGSASFQQVAAELSKSASVDLDKPEGEDEGNSAIADFSSEKSALLYIIIGIALGAMALVFVVVLLYVWSRKRSPVPAAASNYAPRYCNRCGNTVLPGSVFCTACGAPQIAPVPASGSYRQPAKTSPALLIIDIVAAVLMLCGSIYLIFFAGKGQETPVPLAIAL